MPPLVNQIDAEHISCTSNGDFHVVSGNNTYTVSLAGTGPSCECYDWHAYYMPCKHMMAIFSHFPDSAWNTISSLYRNCPMFTLDDNVVPESAADGTVRADFPTCVSELSVQSASAENDGVVSDSVDEDGSAAQQQTSSDDVCRMKSRLRQALGTLSSLSYGLDDISYIQTLLHTVQEHINCAKSKASGIHFPSRNRRRIGKSNFMSTVLSRRLKLVRAKKRLQKTSAKRRRRRRGERLISSAVPLLWLTVLVCTCVTT